MHRRITSLVLAVVVCVSVVAVSTAVRSAIPYTVSASLSQQFVSTADSDAVVSVRVAELTKPIGAAVTCAVIDGFGRTLVEPLPAAVADVRLSVPREWPEGPRLLKYWLRSCVDGLPLSETGELQLVIDNTSPFIPPQSLTPRDHGNTIFASQPLLAQVDDLGGSGVLLQDIKFTLMDESADERQELSASEYNEHTKWAKTSDVPLKLGHVYRVQVKARDRARKSTISLAHRGCSASLLMRNRTRSSGGGRAANRFG